MDGQKIGAIVSATFDTNLNRCIECGNLVPNGAYFCRFCGIRVVERRLNRAKLRENCNNRGKNFHALLLKAAGIVKKNEGVTPKFCSHCGDELHTTAK